MIYPSFGEIGTDKRQARSAGHTYIVRTAQLTPGGVLISGGEDKQIRVWDIDAEKLLGEMDVHRTWSSLHQPRRIARVCGGHRR